MALLAFALLAASCGHAIAAQVGESCTHAAKGVPGTCKKLADCASAISDLELYQSNPQICGFAPGSARAIVCCPDQQQQQDLSQREREKPGTVARRMCLQYSNTAKQKGYCRLKKTATPSLSTPQQLIIDGVPALPKEFPHMALLGYGSPDDVDYSCAGSLISERWILSAAHCIWSRKINSKVTQALLGDLDRSREDDIALPQIRLVGEPIAYPEYSIKSNYHDIALLPLRSPATINEYVRPACLYFDRLPSGSYVNVSGWGVTEQGDEVISDILYKAKLRTVPLADCNRSYSTVIQTAGSKISRGLQDHQMCAGSGGTQDACQGDSGGPLQLFTEENPYCMQHVVGVVSFGIFCGNKTPGVYVRVGAYIEWIEKTVWPGSNAVYRGPDRANGSVPDP